MKDSFVPTRNGVSPVLKGHGSSTGQYTGSPFGRMTPQITVYDLPSTSQVNQTGPVSTELSRADFYTMRDC